MEKDANVTDDDRRGADIGQAASLHRRDLVRGASALALYGAASGLISKPVGAFAKTTAEIDQVAKSYDFIIVGAGSAGCVLANRLSADRSISVLVIEAGGPDTLPEIHDPRAWPFLQGTAIDWAYKTAPQTHVAGRSLAYPRGKVIGGSSAINAMGHQRGHRSVFDGWAKDNPGWGYYDLLPMFIRSESFSGGAGPYHGASGPLGVLLPTGDLRNPVAASYLQAVADLGYQPNADLNGAELMGPCWNQLAIKDLKRQSTGVAYLDPILGRPNLTVLTMATLLKLDIEKTRCVGITYDHDGSPRQVRAERDVILAMGAIDTPKFLMLAGIGPEAALQRLGIRVLADLPGVGQNLQDHALAAGVVYEARQPVPASKLNHGEGMFFALSDTDKKAADLLLMCVTLPFASPVFPAPPANCFSIVPALVSPESRGSVTIASTDPRKSAVIDPNFFAAEADLVALSKGIEIARAIGAGSALAEWRLKENLPGKQLDKAALRAFTLDATGTFYHPVGTCRMGKDRNSVVDADLRVHGIQGLRVVDASVMPHITNAMPNAAVIAIAEKAATLIVHG